MELHELLSHPRWVAGLPKGHIAPITPVAMVGPTGSGKSSLVNILALARSECGTPTRVIHINPSAMNPS
jgi:ABC-type lipoprotein export system ATPase subunit